MQLEIEHQIILQHGTQQDATLEITGVQLEVGSVATDFEHRSYGQELALCRKDIFINHKQMVIQVVIFFGNYK